jgi:hypothetical protein
VFWLWLTLLGFAWLCLAFPWLPGVLAGSKWLWLALALAGLALAGQIWLALVGFFMHVVANWLKGAYL